MAVRIAYQGVPGAYSEKAVHQLLGKENVNAVGFASFADTFRAVQSKSVDFGLVPIENSLGGSIHANYDLLLQHDLHIVAEYDLRVEHCLLAFPGMTKEDIQHVISHPQALAQCENFVKQLGAQPRPEYDTAGSAKMVKELAMKDTAAIASDLAATHYGLDILEKNIEDDANNFTRFLLLSRSDYAEVDKTNLETKTSILFSFKEENECGQLYKALSTFAMRDIDLTKIESRPWGYSAAKLAAEKEQAESVDFSNKGSPAAITDRRKYKYLFYVDIIGQQRQENIVNAIRHLHEVCNFVRILGSYPSKGVLIEPIQKLLVNQVSPSSPIRGGSRSTTIQPSDNKLNIGIFGFGKFGQFLARTMTKYHRVRGISRTNYAGIAESLHVSYYQMSEMAEFFEDLDVVIFAVSIVSFESILKSVPSQFFQNKLVVDVLSVKNHAKQVMLRILPSNCDILCTHPMYGPESGKYSWRNLNMMYEKVRIVSNDTNAQRCAKYLSIFHIEMCNVLEMTCDAHDAFAANSQFVTHLTGRVLNQLHVANTPIDTRGFKNLVRLVHDTVTDSDDLFHGLYKYNPNAEQLLNEFTLALDSISKSLTSAAAPAQDKPGSIALNPLMDTLSVSKTNQIHGLTKQLENQGETVYSLCVGEPDFLPHDDILTASKSAFDAGCVKYTEVAGMFKLRQLISQYLETFKGVKYDPASEIVVSNGAKQSVYQTCLLLCKPKDEVLIPAPYWVSYPEIVKLVQGVPVILPTRIEESYLVNPVTLENTLRLHPRIKAMILCNPSNPAGVLHSETQLRAIAKVFEKPEFQHIVIIADEIYEQLVYQDERTKIVNQHVCFASLPNMYNRTTVINGFSKSHAMTGLRIGYMAAPAIFSKAALKLQSQTTSCANSIGQMASIKALEMELARNASKEERLITDTLSNMTMKRNYVVSRLDAMNHVKYAYPDSAFYVFIELEEYIGNGYRTVGSDTVLETSEEFCTYLLRKFHTAIVPGSAFGIEHAVRISYATSMEILTHAMNNLEKCLNSLIKI